MRIYNDAERRLVALFERWALLSGADITDHSRVGALHLDRASWEYGGEYVLLRCEAAPGADEAPFGSYATVWRQRYDVAVAWFDEYIARLEGGGR